MKTNMDLCEIGKLIFGSIKGRLIEKKKLPCLIVSAIKTKMYSIWSNVIFVMVVGLECLLAGNLNHGMKCPSPNVHTSDPGICYVF